MKSSIGIRIYFIAVLSFLTIWNFAGSLVAFNQTKEGLDRELQILSLKLEQHLLINDDIGARETLGRLKSKEVPWVQLHKSEWFGPQNSIISVGQTPDCTFLCFPAYQQKVYSNGGFIGMVRVQFSTLSLLTKPLTSNSLAYTFFVLFSSLILFLVRIQEMTRITKIEKIVNQFNSKIAELNTRSPSDLTSINDDFSKKLSSILGNTTINSELQTLFNKIFKLNSDFSRSQEARRIAQQVSHDIKSPLGALNIGLKFIQEENVKKMVAMASSRINDILNDLSKSSFENTLQSSSFHCISETVRSVIDEKRLLQSSRKEICFQVLDTFDRKIFAFCDKSQLSRVISNLINNSIEAIEDQGNIVVSIEEDNKLWSIKVRDDGKGISNHNLSKIFMDGVSFKRNDGLPNRGMGLFHAKKAALAWGGDISVQSRISEWTEFTITIPKYEFRESICSGPQDIKAIKI